RVAGGVGFRSDVDLATQIGDIGLDDAGVAAEVVLPHVVEDLRLRHHAVRVGHEVAQQLEFGGGGTDEDCGAGGRLGGVGEGWWICDFDSTRFVLSMRSRSSLNSVGERSMRMPERRTSWVSSSSSRSPATMTAFSSSSRLRVRRRTARMRATTSSRLKGLVT